MPQAKKLAPSTEHILKNVCKSYNVTIEDLYKTRRGEFNELRSVAVYLIRIIRLDSLVEISKVFRIDKYSSTSSIIERLKERMKADKKLSKRVETLLKNVRKT